MTTATCPKGHDSATLDYCDTCGSPMGGASRAAAPAPVETQPVPAGPPAAAEGKTCPVCGTFQAGRFCEEDGYDFLLAPPVSTPAAAQPAVEPPVAGPPREAGPAAVPPGPGPAAVSSGEAPAGGGGAPAAGLLIVGASKAYFDTVIAQGGEDAGGMVFPRFAAERRFPLDGERLLIGRRSRTRGIHPDIDLGSQPEDPGVSHSHALLLNEDGRWSIVDLNSANGTYVNDPASAPIPPETPVPLKPGDVVFVGAWTSLTLRMAQ